MTLTLSDKKERWRCRKVGCMIEKIFRSGMWLSGIHLPYTTVCLFLYSWAHDITTLKFCKRELDIKSDDTIVNWNSYISEVCAEKIISTLITFGGEGIYVEIDESLFVSRKYNVGRLVGQQWVFGGDCRETRKSFIYAVPYRSATTLIPIISECILPGTIIIRDKWAAYHSIGVISDRQYIHLTVEHTNNFVDPESQAHTNSVKGMWARAKARNKKQWGTHRTMLDSYLCYYMWRQRNSERDPFLAIIKDIVLTYPLEL